MRVRNFIRSILIIAFVFHFLACKKNEIKKSIDNTYNIVLNEWYFTNPKDSVKIYIQEYGVGQDTIIALHGGFGAEHRYLEELFKDYYNDYHFIFYDQRGSLRSPCSLDKVSIQNHISDLEAIRNEFNIKKLNLFGHSNGSTLATLYLKEYPNNVKGFIMTACMQMERPLNEELKQIENEQYKNFGDYINRKEVQVEINKVNSDSVLPESKKKALIAKINHAKHYIYNISLWKKGMETYGGMFSVDAGNRTTQSMQEVFINGYSNIDAYKNHPYPITIIMGEMDMIDPYGKKFEYWSNNLPNVNYVLLKKAAHDPWIDKPQEFKKAFKDAMNLYERDSKEEFLISNTLIKDSIWFKTYKKFNNHILSPKIIDVLRATSEDAKLHISDVGFFNMLVQNYDCNNLKVADFQIKYPFAKSSFVEDNLDALVKAEVFTKSDKIYKLSEKGKKLLSVLKSNYEKIDDTYIEITTVGLLKKVSKQALSNQFNGINKSIKNCQNASLRFDDSKNIFLQLMTIMNDLVALRNDQSHYRYSFFKNKPFDFGEKLNYPMIELLAGMSSNNNFQENSFNNRPTWGYTKEETKEYLNFLIEKDLVIQEDSIFKLTSRASEIEQRASTKCEEHFYQTWLFITNEEYRKFKAIIQ